MNEAEFLYANRDNLNTENGRFLGQCLSHNHLSQSQNFQDVWAAYRHEFMTGQFFVEFGATDGIEGSNTYMLEKVYGWDGILAEPNPVWHEGLKINRNAITTTECVWTETGKTLEFLNVKEAQLSTIKGFGEGDEHSDKRRTGETIKVETISLIDLLKENAAPKHIAYMSVDTEGSEFDILNTFFRNPMSENYDIRCITVEHNHIPANRQRLYNLLTERGYKREFEIFSRWDDFYVKDYK
jgi:FkbM family methyltransferase